MTHFPDHMPKIEQTIANRLITAILKAGRYIAVRDECSLALKPTRDRAAIQRETAATGLTYYIVCDPMFDNPEQFIRRGTIMLVHGNLEDVVSDASAPTDALLDEMEVYMEAAT